MRGKYALREYAERSATGGEPLLSVSEYFGVKPRRDAIEADEHLSRAESPIGYEIPFNRHSCQYEPPRDLAEIDADLDVPSAEIMEMLREVRS